MATGRGTLPKEALENLRVILVLDRPLRRPAHAWSTAPQLDRAAGTAAGELPIHQQLFFRAVQRERHEARQGEAADQLDVSPEAKSSAKRGAATSAADHQIASLPSLKSAVAMSVARLEKTT